MDVMSNQKGKKKEGKGEKNRNTGRNQVEDMATKVGHHGRKCIQLTILITPALRVCVCVCPVCALWPVHFKAFMDMSACLASSPTQLN